MQREKKRKRDKEDCKTRLRSIFRMLVESGFKRLTDICGKAILIFTKKKLLKLKTKRLTQTSLQHGVNQRRVHQTEFLSRTKWPLY